MFETVMTIGTLLSLAFHFSEHCIVYGVNTYPDSDLTVRGTPNKIGRTQM